MISIEKFEQIAELSRKFTKRPTNAEFLEFYGLYKQATAGDITSDKPGMMDLTAKAKWDAWNAHKGMTKEAAREAYVKIYEKYAPIYA